MNKKCQQISGRWEQYGTLLMNKPVENPQSGMCQEKLKIEGLMKIHHTALFYSPLQNVGEFIFGKSF